MSAEYKKNKKSFDLQFKKKVGEIARANKRKLEAEKKPDEWNEKRKKWVKPSSQVGYKALTVREVFIDMKNEPSDSNEYKNCIKFVERCEVLLNEGKFDIEGNDAKKRKLVVGAGPPKKVVDVRKQLFEYFVDVRSALKSFM